MMHREGLLTEKRKDIVDILNWKIFFFTNFGILLFSFSLSKDDKYEARGKNLTRTYV